MIQTKFIDNCSHGYLEVNITEFKKVMGADAKKITGYSGISKDRVYLEEDLDAGTFLNTAKVKGYLIQIDNDYRPNFECPKNYSVRKLNAN